MKALLPVRSAIIKHDTGGLVVRWVTTGEYLLLPHLLEERATIFTASCCAARHRLSYRSLPCTADAIFPIAMHPKGLYSKGQYTCNMRAHVQLRLAVFVSATATPRPVLAYTRIPHSSTRFTVDICRLQDWIARLRFHHWEPKPPMYLDAE